MKKRHPPDPSRVPAINAYVGVRRNKETGEYWMDWQLLATTEVGVQVKINKDKLNYPTVNKSDPIDCIMPVRLEITQ